MSDEMSDDLYEFSEILYEFICKKDCILREGFVPECRCNMCREYQFIDNEGNILLSGDGINELIKNYKEKQFIKS